jgi:rRNA maturation protein Nop10
MNKSGNIVSKAKFIICKSEPSRFSKSDQFRKEQTLAKKNAYNNLSL